jgi:hypothetical protein
MVDAIAGLLDGPRARGAFVLRSMLAPPWALRIEDRAPLTLVALVRGRAHVRADDGLGGNCARETSPSCAVPMPTRWPTTPTLPRRW